VECVGLQPLYSLNSRALLDTMMLGSGVSKTQLVRAGRMTAVAVDAGPKQLTRALAGTRVVH